ncbi:branched-chain amino acid ABC transporter permease, partial [Halorubrum persicum]
MTVLGYLANGLVFSSIIVLGSIGLSLVYSIADFANFAHGDTMTIGAYTALVTFGAVGGLGGAVLGLPYGFFLALVVGIVVAAVVAVGTEKLIYEPLDVDSIGLLITSIGIAFIYRAVIQIRFGSGFTRFDIQTLRPIEALLPYGIRVTLHDVAIVASAAVLVVGLHVLLQYTDLGRKMRARSGLSA